MPRRAAKTPGGQATPTPVHPTAARIIDADAMGTSAADADRADRMDTERASGSASGSGFDYTASLARGSQRRGRAGGRAGAGGSSLGVSPSSGSHARGQGDTSHPGASAHARAPRHGASSSSPSDPSASSPDHTGQIPAQRALVSAHPVTRKQSALVTRQSHKLPGIAPATRTTKAVTIVSESGNATTVLPAARRPHAHAGLPALAPARKGRRLGIPAGVLVAVAILAVIAGALYTISPLSPIRNHASEFAPQAALMALNANDAQSGGPWDTSAGAAQALGLGGGAGPGVTAPGSAGLPVANGGDGGNFTASPGAIFISAAPITPWPPGDPFMAVPSHVAYRVNTSGGYYSGAFGQCTWWAAYSRRDENLTYLGNARYWAIDAQARGYRVGHQAAPNATVVFYPGAQGAGGAGHVAHVEAVYPDGWFLVSEMNFYWNGGGWGRVDYRFAHEGWGVAFIY